MLLFDVRFAKANKYLWVTSEWPFSFTFLLKIKIFLTEGYFKIRWKTSRWNSNKAKHQFVVISQVSKAIPGRKIDEKEALKFIFKPFLFLFLLCWPIEAINDNENLSMPWSLFDDREWVCVCEWERERDKFVCFSNPVMPSRHIKLLLSIRFFIVLSCLAGEEVRCKITNGWLPLWETAGSCNPILCVASPSTFSLLQSGSKSLESLPWHIERISGVSDLALKSNSQQ